MLLADIVASNVGKKRTAEVMAELKYVNKHSMSSLVTYFQQDKKKAIKNCQIRQTGHGIMKGRELY